MATCFASFCSCDCPSRDCSSISQSFCQREYAWISLGFVRRAPAFLSKFFCRFFSYHMACHAVQPIDSFWLRMRLRPCEPSCSTRFSFSFSSSACARRAISASWPRPSSIAWRACSSSFSSFAAFASAASRPLSSATYFCSTLMAAAAYRSASQECFQSEYDWIRCGLVRRAPAFLSKFVWRRFSSHMPCHAVQPIASFWLSIFLMPIWPRCATRFSFSFSSSSSARRCSSASRPVPSSIALRAALSSVSSCLTWATSEPCLAASASRRAAAFAEASLPIDDSHPCFQSEYD